MVFLDYLYDKNGFWLYLRVALDYHIGDDEIVLSLSKGLQNMRIISFIPMMSILPCFRIP